MTVLQDRGRHLIRLLAEHKEYRAEVNTAVVAVWDAAKANADGDDENLVAMAITLADSVTDFYLFGGTAEDCDLAARCYTMASRALAINQGPDSPSPA
jgi:hypothetical protein